MRSAGRPSVQMSPLVVFGSFCLLLAFAEEGSEEVCRNNDCSSGKPEDAAQKLVDKAWKQSEWPKAHELFEQALRVHPNNCNALVQLGWRGLMGEGAQQSSTDEQELAAERLRGGFDGCTPDPIPIHSEPGKMMASLLGTYHSNRREYSLGRIFWDKAASSAAATSCERARAASFLTGFPESVEHAAEIVATYHKRMESLLAMEVDLAVPGDLEKNWGLCLQNPFDHSLYYEGDAGSALSKWGRLAARLFPQLLYVSPHLRPPPVLLPQRRVRLGVASGFMGSRSSVMDDFGGVLDQLPREKFEITFIFINESTSLNVVASSMERFKNDAWITLAAGHGWLKDARRRVALLDLDLLLYLDLTMIGATHQLAMSRLARVQAVSHGHPMSSGIDKSVMNYYISWAAAEIPTAHEHYTEELALLPAETMHQYYYGRVINGTISQQTNEPFDYITRQHYPIPESGRWYLCMQKPFKLHPHFDEMLGGISKADPEARFIFHEVDLDALGFDVNKRNKNTFMERLRRAGVNMERVHFIGYQVHHALMGLYRVSDVILDSYHAGGCTTTREAFQVGAVVVTLPSKYLGSRWSLAYYSILGVLDLVATDAKDYVAKAVHMATDKKARSEVSQKVKDNMHKLFYRTEPVEEWTKLLLRLASKASDHHQSDLDLLNKLGNGSMAGKGGKGGKGAKTA